MMTRILTVFSTLLVTVTVSMAQQREVSSSLKVGDTAPDFLLPYATKDTIIFAPRLRLSDLVGKRNLVLAFYPADWSGGCTKEVCTFRDNFSDFQDLNAEVLGISGDYVFSHHEWAKHHNLPFKLLSDHSHEVAKKYDSYNEASGMNKRTVFIIDSSGKIAYMNLKYDVRTPDDFEKLRNELAKLKRGS